MRQGMTKQGATSDWLQAMLERTNPRDPVQVINLGISRARTDKLVDLVDTMLEPELVVILAGNNDTQPPPDATHELLADWPAYRAAHELLLADVQAAFLAQSDDGLPDPALFMDYCHATWRGYHATARTILDVIHSAGLLPPPDRPVDLGPEAMLRAKGWQDLPNAVPRLQIQPNPPPAERGSPPTP